MTKGQFKKFQERNGLTTEEMAKILCLTEQSVYKKRSGEREVNLRDVALMNQYLERKKLTA